MIIQAVTSYFPYMYVRTYHGHVGVLHEGEVGRRHRHLAQVSAGEVYLHVFDDDACLVGGCYLKDKNTKNTFKTQNFFFALFLLRWAGGAAWCVRKEGAGEKSRVILFANPLTALPFGACQLIIMPFAFFLVCPTYAVRRVAPLYTFTNFAQTFPFTGTERAKGRRKFFFLERQFPPLISFW